MKHTGTDDALCCSFCHKSQDAVGTLISSPGDSPRAYICDECIAVCNSVLQHEDVLRHRVGTPPKADLKNAMMAHAEKVTPKAEQEKIA